MIMRRFITSALLLLMAVLWVSGISPYLKLSTYEAPMNEVVGTITTLLEEGGYEVIGQYQPGDNPELYVLVFTSDELIAFCQQSEDRGMLAAAMKVGFQESEGKISVSMVNPEYLFYAYGSLLSTGRPTNRHGL